MRPRGRRLQACCVRPLWSLHRLLVTCGPGLKGRVGFRPTATGLEAAFLPFSFKEKGPPRALFSHLGLGHKAQDEKREQVGSGLKAAGPLLGPGAHL